MTFKPMKLMGIKDPAPGEWRIDAINGGVVYTDSPQKILDVQSPSMLNLWFKEKVLTKRYGQEYLFNSLGSFPILSVYDKLFNGKVIFTASTNMYSLDLTTKTTTLLYSLLTATKGSFFVMSGILYYFNGHEFVQYNGTTVTSVVGYIPLVLTGRAPTGGGTVNEQYNRLAAGFRTSFSAVSSATIYTLPQTGLDATAVTATVGGVPKAETTDFTVDRPNGIVTFTTAPPTGTDNVVITAYKTDTVGKAAILACKYSITFGGNNDSRVFVAGDSTTYYYSGLLDPTFWPENQYNNAGVDSSFIYGFGKQYDVLVVFKEKSMYSVTYAWDGTKASFPMTPLSDSVGCDMPYTIQNINDQLVWCNTYSGVQILVSTLLKSEKDIHPLSENINGTLENPGLMSQAKADLQNATTVDFFGMYWLCVGSKVWAWDYNITPFVNSGDQYADQRRLAWFPFDTINANCFFGSGGELYYGDRTVGQFIHFTNSYSDFGTAINTYWQSKLLDFGKFDWTKVILELRARSKSDTYTAVTTTYFYDDGNRVDATTDTIAGFRWDRFRWDLFTWNVIQYAKSIVKRPKIKNTVHFGVMFSNNIDGNNLSILDLVILYMLYRKVK